MKAQSNILAALGEANAAYACSRRAVRVSVAARLAAIDVLLHSHASFTAILTKAQDADNFYTKLSAQVRH